jgi:hypothetical protein
MITQLARSLRSSHLLTLSLVGHALQQVHAQPGGSLYTIPVVFHVLHQNGNENISELQIADAMTILNAYYDAPTWDIDPPFDTVAADMDISFVLASVAPDGSPTTGIERIETPLTVNAGATESYLNPWPRNRYLNIWTVASLDGNGASYITARPELAAGTPCTDGIMLYHSYVGTIGTAGLTARRTLTQAIGRFFNLKMLWEDQIDGGPCGDDEVADTPPCTAISFCNAENALCSNMPANIENFMIFSYCQQMFTLGQRARVHACLNSPVAQRNELASGNSTSSPDCFTAIADHGAAARITAYPSPFTDRIFLRDMPDGRYNVELKDLSGRTVASTHALMAGEPFVVSGTLARGSYLLRVDDERTMTVLSVVKE